MPLHSIRSLLSSIWKKNTFSMDTAEWINVNLGVTGAYSSYFQTMFVSFIFYQYFLFSLTRDNIIWELSNDSSFEITQQLHPPKISSILLGRVSAKVVKEFLKIQIVFWGHFYSFVPLNNVIIGNYRKFESNYRSNFSSAQGKIRPVGKGNFALRQKPLQKSCF